MQHEAAIALAGQGFDLLLIVGRAKRHRDECLGLAPREDRRAVRAGKRADLGPDRADLVERPAVEPRVAFENLGPQHLLAQRLEDPFGGGALVLVLLRDRCEQVGLHPIDLLVVLDLALDPHRLGQRFERLTLDLLLYVGRDRLRSRRQFRFGDLAGHGVDLLDDLSDGLVSSFERLDDLFLRDFQRPGLDHHERVAAAGDDEVESALCALRVGGVDHDLVVDQPDPDGRDRLLEGDAREGECGRGAGQRQDVGIVLAV